MSAKILYCARVLLADGWQRNISLHIDDHGMISDVSFKRAAEPAQTIQGPVIPGMPNLHSHGFQRLIAGLTGRRAACEDSFWTWRESMYRMTERITPEQLQGCLGGVYLHMLRNGYTACAEFHYLHHAPGGQTYQNPAEMSERVMAAAQETGIGLTHLPVLYCRSGFGAETVNEQQLRFYNGLDAYLSLLDACGALIHDKDTCRLGLAPHSLRAVDGETLGALIGAAWEPGVPVHIHIAEQPLETEDCLAHTSARPVEWLTAKFDVGPDWCLVHATHMSSQELVAAAGCGAVAGLCPTTEADLGDGFFAAREWIDAGGVFGVGSDSNLRISPMEELRLLEFGERLRSGQRNVLADEDRSCGRFLYEHACAGGAQALGQPVGRIAPGLRADLVELDGSDPRLVGLSGDELLDTYVFTGDSSMIRSVYVAGDCLLDQGHHRGEEDLERSFARTMRELRS